ncbi:MAG: class I SAM-dependent RNA methyltransferase [Balneolaceae bacterium]
MADFNRKGTVTITCPLGITPWLHKEIAALGFQPLYIRDTGLEIEASLNDCINLNFWLRTAHRIHFLLDEKKVGSTEQLYEWVYSLNWQDWISPLGYVSVTSRIDHPAIENNQIANLTAKDAIVDKIRQQTGSRPDSGSDLNKTVVFLYWDREIARIFIDTSGESLSRRGYRSESTAAPMQESLASAIIMATKWKPGDHFINPMAGSGTLAIEAALMAQNRPPASLRNNFGFMHIRGFDENIYQEVRRQARLQTVKEISGEIIAGDIDKNAISSATKNATNAGVEHLIKFENCHFEKTTIPNGNGIVVLNPPYGVRLDDDKNLIPLYRQIGDFLKTRCPGKTGYVFTGNFNLAKKIGLRSSQRIPFYNSTIECRLLEFELYKGSRYNNR